MNIDDPVGVFFDHLLRNHYKESCQHNQIHMIGIQLFQEILIEFFSACIIFRTDADAFDSMLLCALQSICILIVADHHFDFCVGDCLIFNSINDGL